MDGKRTRRRRKASDVEASVLVCCEGGSMTAGCMHDHCTGPKRKEYIKKEDLKRGSVYLCKARNFTEGLWTGSSFLYMREKFGSTFPDTEKHWDDGAPFGTVKPIKEIIDG